MNWDSFLWEYCLLAVDLHGKHAYSVCLENLVYKFLLPSLEQLPNVPFMS